MIVEVTPRTAYFNNKETGANLHAIGSSLIFRFQVETKDAEAFTCSDLGLHQHKFILAKKEILLEFLYRQISIYCCGLGDYRKLWAEMIVRER